MENLMFATLSNTLGALCIGLAIGLSITPKTAKPQWILLLIGLALSLFANLGFL